MSTPVTARADRLTVRYGRLTAVDSVSFDVPKGAVFALLGRNGSGKSSLVRCLLGWQKPEAGRCELLGEDPWARRARLMERVGVVPEEPDAPREMTPRQLGAFCARLYPAWDAKGYEGRLSRFGVPPATPFGRLSKGQKGLTQLSLALASSPELLVLDDPTLGLDPVARHAFFDEIVAELADRGTTVVLTTHDLAGVERIADRVGILKDGRLLLAEETEALKGRFRTVRYRSEVTENRTDFGDELDEMEPLRAKVRGWGIEAVVSGFTDERFARFAAKEGISDAEAAPLSLEELFLAVAGEGKGAAR
ncbi:MAG: ABC transporter ATP-binding protein [Thermoanaerobaculia bacterium]